MFEPYQVAESRALGADCILIIMASRRRCRGQRLEDAALAFGMDVLVEVHDEAELDRALQARIAADRHQQPRPQDLQDLARGQRAAGAARARRPASIVGESGIHTPADLARLAAVGIRAFLVGESLMRQSDVAAATRALLARERVARPSGEIAVAKKPPPLASSRHLGKGGEARMVDVSGKDATERDGGRRGPRRHAARRRSTSCSTATR